MADVIKRDLTSYRELVFCGFGEPTFRIDDDLWLVDELRARGFSLPPVRINTNGHGSLINGRDIVPGLVGRIDTLSISLNGSTAERYCAVTRPKDGQAAWSAMLNFTRKAAACIPCVYMTVVDKDEDSADLERCRALAASLGAKLRIRAYIAD